MSGAPTNNPLGGFTGESAWLWPFSGIPVSSIAATGSAAEFYECHERG